MSIVGITALVLGLVIILLQPLFVEAVVTLPCRERPDMPLRSHSIIYCTGRNYVTPSAHQAMVRIAMAVAPMTGTPVVYLDAGNASTTRRLWPHLSHRNGKQVDVALYYRDKRSQAPLEGPPTALGYGSYEPPKPGERNPCAGKRRPADFGDPESPHWEWDKSRTRSLVDVILADALVRRIFIAPHLADRLEVAGHPKVKAAGCHAARHDDHIHIDFH